MQLEVFFMFFMCTDSLSPLRVKLSVVDGVNDQDDGASARDWAIKKWFWPGFDNLDYILYHLGLR